MCRFFQTCSQQKADSPQEVSLTGSVWKMLQQHPKTKKSSKPEMRSYLIIMHLYVSCIVIKKRTMVINCPLLNRSCLVGLAGNHMELGVGSPIIDLRRWWLMVDRNRVEMKMVRIILKNDSTQPYLELGIGYVESQILALSLGSEIWQSIINATDDC